jgi:glycosyltransferase involved in cell wall biosynthesis
MKVILLTPGTGSYHCGVCMRDNALARELLTQGHDAMLLPMYLPLTLDEAPAQPETPVFFGGVNVFLQQKFAWFRSAPPWVDRVLNHPALLRWAGRRSGMTGGAEIGELTHSMLLGEEGHQNRELEKLVDWLLAQGRPDAVWLSTALLTGLARRIRQALGVPVLCSLQGEDSFLDGLDQPWRTRCWQTLAARSSDVARFIAPSAYYGQLMRERMGLSPEQVRVIPNGISVDGFEPRQREPADPVIGYLARMVEGKGLGLLVDAFILLKKRGRFPQARLRCAGAMTSGDAAYVARLRKKLAAARCGADVEFLPNVTREEKIAFLQGLTLFSVPATYSEAFGLYVLEAMAAGVPVSQPRASAFPEIVLAADCGVLHEPGDPESLADSWEMLLANPAKARDLGRKGRAAVENSMPAMARAFLQQTAEVIDAQKAVS